MDDLMKKVIEDYFGEPMPENVNLTCPTTLHDCIEIAKHYAAQQYRAVRRISLAAEHSVQRICCRHCGKNVSIDDVLCSVCGTEKPANR